MLKTYFIVGTDTDCGKTYATARLIEALHHANVRADALKPLASGCHVDSGQLISEDVLRLQQANGHSNYPIYNWLMEPPISPHLAAKLAGFTLSVEEILSFCHGYPAENLEYLLIEGAGGLMVPLNDHETWVDFLVQSRIPVILVVGMRLGCINHALLTMSVLKSHGISCRGWIANFIDPLMLVSSDVCQTLIDKMDAPLLGTVPYKGSFVWDKNIELSSL